MFDFFLPSLTVNDAAAANAPVVTSKRSDPKSKKSPLSREPEELLDIALADNPTNVLMKRLPRTPIFETDAISLVALNSR